MPCPLGSTTPVEVNPGVKKFKIGLIADLDKLSKEVDNEGDTVWKSLILTGSLTYDYNNETASIEMHSEDEAIAIKSSYSRGMRGMELSELIGLGGKYYTVCDRTGIVYEIVGEKVIPRAVLANGDGYQDKGFKGEWMTTKDNMLYVGSHGREFTDNGTIVNSDMQWVKEIDSKGGVAHVNWRDNYDALRNAVGCPFPGYLSHESGVWSKVHKQWFFLPRKISKEPYDDKADETRCGNTLLRASDDFKDIKYLTIGTLTPSRGYSSFKFVPGTGDNVIVAIKSEEIGNSQKTFITVFDVNGKVLLDDHFLADAKYEGLEFIDK